MNEREQFKKWFAGAVKDAAYKADGLAAYAFADAGGKLPPMITGDYKRGDPAFQPGSIRSANLRYEHQQIDVSSIGGARRSIAGPTSCTLEIEAEHDPRFFDLFNKGEEFEIDMNALLKNQGWAPFENYRWRMQQIDMSFNQPGSPLVTMTLHKVN